jgi:pimeloyl-ACP methyl ester carboxylesterase
MAMEPPLTGGDARSPEGKQPRHVIVTLVHGTWAAGAPWTRSASLLCKGLQEFYPRLVEKLGCASDHASLTFAKPFAWSGKNLHRDRCLAASNLQQQLRDQAKANPGAAQVIVGHSHGGNIALAALAGLDPACRIAGVICLNTPFITVLRRNTWQFLNGIVLSTLLITGWCLFNFFGWWGAWLKGSRLMTELGPRVGLYIVLGTSVIFVLFTYVGILLKWRHEGARFAVWIEKKAEEQFANLSLPPNLSVPVLSLWTAGDEVITILNLLEALANLPFMFFNWTGLVILVVFVLAAVLAGWLPVWVPELNSQAIEAIVNSILRLPLSSYLTLFLALAAFSIAGGLILVRVNKGDRLIRMVVVCCLLVAVFLIPLHTAYMLGWHPQWLESLIDRLPPPFVVDETADPSTASPWYFFLVRLPLSVSGLIVLILGLLVVLGSVANFCFRNIPAGIGVDRFWQGFLVRLTFSYVPVSSANVRFFDLQFPFGWLMHSAIYNDHRIIYGISVWILSQVYGDYLTTVAGRDLTASGFDFITRHWHDALTKLMVRKSS